MEGNAERECSALGGLFQQIIQDMKNGTPLWEDLVVKATKLHTCLRATIAAISSYLDAFQKIADAATNTRGATKEIGTALTRICLRHRAVEARMKTFSSAIMDCLVVPLQEKIEDWKKAVINLDKDHAKDYKRARAELKKRSTDTLRLQKKARKGCKGGGELQRRVETCLADVNERRMLLEDAEKKAVRAALVEERSRFCVFVAFMKPVVDEEVAMLSELSHLQEVVVQLEKHTADPYTLPPASEQVIADLKGSDNGWTWTSPPSSPSSLGSRKSSMCSISSLNSSSSGSGKSHHSPSHQYWHRSLSQRPVPPGTLRLSSVSSRDSGFTSQDTVFPLPPVPTGGDGASSGGSTPAGGAGGPAGQPNPTATWPNLQETLQFERAATAIMNDRPHTISTAYERGHQRPALTVYTFHAPEACQSQPSSPTPAPLSPPAPGSAPVSAPSPRPPLPQRCSSLERPSVPAKSGLALYSHPADSHVDTCSGQPMYVNMHDLASLAASKAQAHAQVHDTFPPPPPELAPDTHAEKTEGPEKDSSTSESSLESSSGYGSQTMPGVQDDGIHTEVDPSSVLAANNYCTLPRTNPDLRRRPFSTAGYPSGTMRNTLLRRGSMQQQKPPPPIRRTSSISRGVCSSAIPGGNGSLEHLPPPPAFLLEGGAARAANAAELQRNAASSIAAEIQKRNAAANAAAIAAANANTSEYQRTAALGIAAELQRKVAYLTDRKPEPIYGERKITVKETQGGISVAETVRTLTELKHQPASPVSARRAPHAAAHAPRAQSCDRRVETGLIATLSAKLAPTLSPRHSRRHSQETGFVSAANRANRVRQWIAVRTVPDPTICHDSLMDQIKRGTSLKKTRAVNDRSAPRIR